MCVVSKAEDLTFTRIAVLNPVPRNLHAHEPERAGLPQEAPTAAVLNHPNIRTIHDIQGHDGQPFVVMEYVEGKTPRAVVPAENLQNAIACAIQMDGALEEAHTHGIVHRDVRAARTVSAIPGVPFRKLSEELQNPGGGSRSREPATTELHGAGENHSRYIRHTPRA